MDRRLRSGGQQWTEREAREALAELQDRGESVAAFAQRPGMSVQRVYYWRRRLRETAAPAFVAMPLTAVASDQIASSQSKGYRSTKSRGSGRGNISRLRGVRYR
jgi:transposase-like protein